MSAVDSRQYIAISGMIGAGKSTLAAALARELACPVYFESVGENAYLADFYADQRRYAFALQVHLLNQRFAQQQQIVWSRQSAVQDRSIYEDRVFAKMLADAGVLERRDYETYVELFANMMHFMEKPTLIVHLDVTPEQSLERIRARGRECERGITLDYLRALHAGYEAFLDDISRSIRVVRVDWSDYSASPVLVVARLKQACDSMRNVTSISLK